MKATLEVSLDGADLVYVRSVETLENSGLTRVVCDTNEGEKHEFIYGINSRDQRIIHCVVNMPEERE